MNDNKMDDVPGKWILGGSFSLRERGGRQDKTLLGDLGVIRLSDGERRRQMTGGEGGKREAERRNSITIFLESYSTITLKLGFERFFNCTPKTSIRAKENAANVALSSVWLVPLPGFPLQCRGRSRVP